jgi:hypothetical protein
VARRVHGARYGRLDEFLAHDPRDVPLANNYRERCYSLEKPSCPMCTMCDHTRCWSGHGEYRQAVSQITQVVVCGPLGARPRGFAQLTDQRPVDAPVGTISVVHPTTRP